MFKANLFLVLLAAILISACGGGGNVDIPPGDDGGVFRGEVFITGIDLLIMESYPVQVMVTVNGDLPTPCNHLQFDIAEADENNGIHIDMYSLANEDEICIQVLEPFSENISLPLAGLPDGEYSVFVNGELVGTFTYPA